MCTKEDFAKYANMAAELPQDSSKPIYQDLNGNQMNGVTFLVIEGNVYPTPSEVFDATHWHEKRGNYYYVSHSKVDEQGNILPKKVYRHTLMFHKKWARKDIPVKDVTFDVIGLKRKSTKLPAGVLITNVNYVL